MKKKAIKTISAVLLCVILAAFSGALMSCRTGVGIYWRDIGLSYAVPDGRLADLKGHHHDVLETDEQGRELIAFYYDTHFGGVNKSAVAILQKHDQRYVYFYEDICYRYGEPSDEITADLKAVNDWGKPLDESKMSKRKMKMTIGGEMISETVVDTKSIDNILEEEIGSELWNNRSDFSLFDVDQHGREVWALYTKQGDMYVILLDNGKGTAHIQFSSYDAIPEEYAQFKHENGWYYG